ncbi:response regulator transcription factor [Dyadobacter sp. CY312]|uniref:LuxR C-terminal-related transcriptional regulator n=1 Tax=Dyadobacter sp. CY312 TaxID=2907303 RepID=UPI001F284C15|nr:response regulator transcription factor [Dyadobacter sp. CY312]MCE7044629.1 response regulator transcription factor [Dyadobacter sp. CY312]
MNKTNNSSAVKVMLIDDHALVAEGFRELLLKILPPESTVDIFSSTERATKGLEIENYTIVITDLIIPGQNVLNFIATCRKAYEGIIILVISSVVDANSIKSCLAAGANGYLSKAVTSNEIILALEYTFDGKRFISGDLTGRLTDSILFTGNSGLTKKEMEVLRLVAAGNKTKKVAEILFVSPITIMAHKRNIMRKLNLHSSTELVKYVYENNLI